MTLIYIILRIRTLNHTTLKMWPQHIGVYYIITFHLYTQVHLLVSLQNFMHLINTQNVKHKKNICRLELGYVLGCLEIFWVLLRISSKSFIFYHMYYLIWIFIPCMLGKLCSIKSDREFPASAWSFMANLSWNIRIWLPSVTFKTQSLATPPWNHKNLQNKLYNYYNHYNYWVQMSIRMKTIRKFITLKWVILAVCQVTACSCMTCLSLLLFATKFNIPLGPILAVGTRG